MRLRTTVAMKVALNCALVALTLTSAAATYPTASEDLNSALLTVWRRYPSHYNQGHEPLVSVSKARYDCATSKMTETWTSFKYYLRAHFRSYTDSFREYVPPPAKQDPASFLQQDQNAQEIPLQRRAPLGSSGRAVGLASSGSTSTQSSSGSGSHSLSTGAIVGIIVGIVAATLLAFALAFACRSGRRRSRPSASEYLKKTPTWKTENAYSHAEPDVTRYNLGNGRLYPVGYGEVDRPVTPPPEARTKLSEHSKVPRIRVS